MEVGQIIYFYQDDYTPCVKGKVNGISGNGLTVSLVDEDNRPLGIRTIVHDCFFYTKEECLLYADKMKEIRKEKLRAALNDKETLLQFICDALVPSNYVDIINKEVIAEKIKEFFDVDVSIELPHIRENLKIPEDQQV